MTPHLPKETPIMAQYAKIKAQYPECLVFFRLGDFYELFGEDAITAAEVLHIVLTARHKNTPSPVPMCGVPAHASDTYISKLVKAGYKVAVCEQLEPATEKEGKGPLHRDVVRVITAGTLLEDDLLDAKQHNFLLSLAAHHAHYFFSCVDISTGDFFVQKYPLSQVEEMLCALNPKEILISQSLWRCETIAPLLKHWKKALTILPDSRFDLQTCEKRLCDFFEITSCEGLGFFSAGEICTAGSLVDYIVLTQKRSMFKLNRPKRYTQDDQVRLDPFTRRNLELFESFSGDTKYTLANMMDCTVTAFGARLLMSRLQSPTCNLTVLQSRLDSVAYFVHHEERRITLQNLLQKIPDLERIVTRLIHGRGQPKEWLLLRQGLGILPHIAPLLDTCSEEIAPLVPLLSAYHTLNQELCAAFQDAPSHQDPQMWIKAGYHEELDTLRNIHHQTAQTLERLQSQYSALTSVTTLKIKYNRIIGHYIEVPPSAVSKMPFEFRLKQTLATGARYTTAELSEVALEFEAATQRAQVLEEEIIRHIAQKLSVLRSSIKETCEYLAILDVSMGLAELAQRHHYQRPTLDHSTEFVIEHGRHPVIEWAFFQQNEQKFIANNCHLTQSYPVWILTGPNMAGKSTFLRQNALITFMAHIGSFVPAKSAHIGLVDRIFTRVGASDDLARGHSTFMVEMIETACILNQATKQSLVILDEVGRGTSTQDGLSIAWACVEYMVEHLQCRTLFSTHYHELVGLNYLPSVRFFTFKITEWNGQIIFFHEVVEGAANQSYGIHIARIAGMPEALLQRAEQLIHQFHAPSPLAKHVL
jgi:DNA mismatch repair protein MutS